jgi:2-isopropylmalate synthase
MLARQGETRLSDIRNDESCPLSPTNPRNGFAVSNVPILFFASHLAPPSTWVRVPSSSSFTLFHHTIIIIVMKLLLAGPTFLLALQPLSAFVLPRSSLSASSSSSSRVTPVDDADTSASASGAAATVRTDDDGTQWITEGIEKTALRKNPLSASRSNNSHDHDHREAAAVVVGPSHVLVFDTTLRDGTQGESISASCDDKLKIANRLAMFEVDFIEAGWPGSNPKDAEFFARAQTELDPRVQEKLVAFGSTRRKKIHAKDDPQIQALVDSQVPTICMVAKAHPWQVTEILRATLQENLDMIEDSVAYLVGLGKVVLIDLEHFFDGYQADPDYVLQCCQVAVNAGASCLVMCDTNGGTMPWEVERITKEMRREFPTTTIGIHCHNDCGMAVANSVCGSHAGVGLVQGTINGVGERTGNADLCSIIPSLAFHVETKMTCKDKLPELTKLSRYVDEILNRSPSNAAPFVGTSAFAHKGGLHVAAMERNPLSYQHVEPELVGNKMRVLISELSGRQNIIDKMKEVFGDAEDHQKSDRALAILNRVKELEHQGYTFEGAEASVHLMILHASKGYCPPFQVLDYSAQVYDYNMDSASRVLTNFGGVRQDGEGGPPTTSSSRATIKVRTTHENSETLVLEHHDNLQVSDGNGPVDALAKALMRALEPSHPSLGSVELVDYKVRILDPTSATAAATRVMIEFRDTESEKQWTTVSVDRNVISASLNALVDGFEYALIEHAQFCMLCDDAFD